MGKVWPWGNQYYHEVLLKNRPAPKPESSTIIIADIPVPGGLSDPESDGESHVFLEPEQVVEGI